MGVLLKEEQDFYSLPSVYKKLKEYDNSLKVCDSG